MSPEKLFDYLDGTLAPAERAQLERDLTTNAVLQRELAVARQIHKGLPKSREVIGEQSADAEATARAGVFGRRVATAFAALVLLNVLIGMFFIVREHYAKQPTGPDFGPQEAAIRRQLTESIAKSAAANLPPPTIGIPEISLNATAAETEALAQKITTAAEHAGGSATRKLAEPGATVLLVEIPAAAEANFRAAISPTGTALPATTEPAAAASPAGKTFLQVRIVTAPDPAASPR